MTALTVELGNTVKSLKMARPSEGFFNALEITVPADQLEALYHPADLAEYTSLLTPDAIVTVKIIGSENPNLQPIHNSFLLAGLTSSSERKEAGSRVLVATRKKKAQFQAQPLRLDDDLIDEENLLTDSSNLMPAPPAMSDSKSKDDCGGRQPCDDCTCGRAGTTKTDTNQVSKSCGKCELGDAFRCASCPYLGLPAFKPGEGHLVLQLNDDL